MRIPRIALFAVALLVGASGCADLDVANPNDPNAERALDSAGDVESLIAGAYRNWYISNGAYAGISMALGNMAFEYASSAANSGAVFYSSFPRPEIVNATTGQYYPNFEHVYLYNYRALAALASGLKALEDPAIAEELEGIAAGSVVRAQAYGKFVQGLSHATIAVLFDRGFIIDETVELTDASGNPIPQETVDYNALMTQALSYFDEAITLASGADFVIPETWMTKETSAEQLAMIASSVKARYRAAVARNPTERAAVDWQAVLDELDAGLEESWLTNLEYVYTNWLGGNSHLYTSQPGTWSFVTYWFDGMADQSGKYQEWLAVPINDRHPQLETGDFLIITPDTRFPQGATIEEQAANPGEYYMIPTNDDGEPTYTSQWGRPERGTWRWSFYDDTPERSHNAWLWGLTNDIPEMDITQINMLRAEAHLRKPTPDPAAAAALVNLTRTLHGLNATDAGGTNTSCVPRLPDADCGGLMEMVKWEKRMEGRLLGIMQAQGFFDSRGWGDLYLGTALHFPVPAQELSVLQMESYTWGGAGNEGASTGSSYNFPHEGD